MITHTCNSHQIQSQKKTKSRVQILKNCQKLKYQMDATKTIGATERTRDTGRTDGWRG